jgi:putative ABC transport system ATP-binding protein
MNNAVLEVRELVKTFTVDGAPIHAVDHVSFNVNQGEFVGLVGPSGSGKTTLLSILAALLTPTSGEVLIDGQQLSMIDERQRVRLRRSPIGFTYQTNNLIPFLTAKENGSDVETERRNGRSRVRTAVDTFPAGDHLHFLPGQMSGGQQQRVAIARALIHNPALVLADEPTAALDTERAYQVVQTFAGLIHERGGGGIMVTHDLRMCKYVDRVLQMRDGRLIAEFSTPLEIAGLVKAAA